MSKPQSQQKSQDVGHVDLTAMKDSVEKSVTKRSAPRRRSEAANGAKKQQPPTTGAAAAAATAASISTGASSGGGGSGSFQSQHLEKEVVVTPRAPVPVVVTPGKQQHLPAIGGELHSRSGDPTPVKWPHATETMPAPGPLPAMISSLSSQQKEQQRNQQQQHQGSFVSVNGTDMGAPVIRPPAVTALSRLSQRTLTLQDEQQQQQQQPGSHEASKLSAAAEQKMADQSGSRTLGADPIVFQASGALPPVVRMTDDVRAVVAPVPTMAHSAPRVAQTSKTTDQAPADVAVSGAVKLSAKAPPTEAKGGAATEAAQDDSNVNAVKQQQRQQPVRPKPLGPEALGLVPTPHTSQSGTNAMPVGRSAAAAAAMQRSAYPRATTQPLPQRAAHTLIPKEKASSSTQVIPVPPPGPPPVIKEISPAKPSMISAAQAQSAQQPRVMMHRRVDSLQQQQQQQLLAAPQTSYLPLLQQQQVELTRAPAAHYLTPVGSAAAGLDDDIHVALQPAVAAPPMVFSPLSMTEQHPQGQLAAPEVWWAHRQPELASVEQQQPPAVYYEQQQQQQQPQVDQRWVQYAQQPPQLPPQQQQYQTQSQQPTYNMNTGQAILNYDNNAPAAGFGSNEGMTTYYPAPVYDPYTQQQQFVVQPPMYYDVAPASYYNAGASTAAAYYAPASASGGGTMADGFVWNM